VAVQDDRREIELRELFQLIAADEGRSGTDAYLDIAGDRVPFELKSTTGSSVTTVRDFGPDHSRKWQGKHWLVGFYDKEQHLQYARYGSPKRIASWILEKESYVSVVDFSLAGILPDRLTLDDVKSLCGDRPIYSLADARSIQKRQYTMTAYHQKMDLVNGYSADRTLESLKDRAVYIIQRGSTLNNPKIPAKLLKTWPTITRDHAATLRRLVADALTEVQ